MSMVILIKKITPKKGLDECKKTFIFQLLNMASIVFLGGLMGKDVPRLDLDVKGEGPTDLSTTSIVTLDHDDDCIMLNFIEPGATWAAGVRRIKLKPDVAQELNNLLNLELEEAYP